jgi:pyruvate/2-oxoglutarate dehydrogenase complex dihydrolipoamide dehydrogenase (E3) component
MMIRAGNLLAEGRRIPGMAGDSTVQADWEPVARRIRTEATDDWNDRVAVERLERRGATFVRGWGRLDGEGRVLVGERALTARLGIVLDVGARPWVPPIPGLDQVPYWDNRGAIECSVLPASLAVLGGGPIGLELGQVYSRFGTAVTMVEVADRLLAVEEPESSELLERVFRAEGIGVETGCKVERVEHDGAFFTLHLSGRSPVRAERLLVATGRRPDLAGLGIASIGLDEKARAITVDDRLRAAPGVWALGDATGHGAFTHISMYQSRLVVADVLAEAGLDHEEVEPADYRAVPAVTFTDPEIGSVGLSEEAARSAGLSVRVGKADLPSTARGWIHKAGNDGFLKVVEDAERRVLVGATSAGPTGGEVLGLLALAVHAEVPVGTLRSMIYAYPTFHRGIEAALADLSS